jgi:hypothetical protein
MTHKRVRLRKKRGSVRLFKQTISSFDYAGSSHEPKGYEFYVTISRRARTQSEIRAIRATLTEKGRRHFSILASETSDPAETEPELRK